MTDIFDRANRFLASDIYDEAEGDVRAAIDKYLPAAERLTMPDESRAS